MFVQPAIATISCPLASTPVREELICTGQPSGRLPPAEVAEQVPVVVPAVPRSWVPTRKATSVCPTGTSTVVEPPNCVGPDVVQTVVRSSEELGRDASDVTTIVATQPTRARTSRQIPVPVKIFAVRDGRGAPASGSSRLSALT